MVSLRATDIRGIGDELKLLIALAVIVCVFLVVRPIGLFGWRIVKQVRGRFQS